MTLSPGQRIEMRLPYETTWIPGVYVRPAANEGWHWVKPDGHPEHLVTTGRIRDPKEMP